MWTYVLCGAGLLLLLGLALHRRQRCAAAAKPRRKIVVLRPGGDHDAVSAAVRNLDGRVLERLPLVNGFTYEPSRKAGTFVALEAHEDILRVDDDLEMRIHGQPKPSGSRWWWTGNWFRGGQARQSIPWGVNRINAPQAWPVSKGAGVRVAVLDTGIDPTHPDLAGNVAGGINLVTAGGRTSDDHGHGTHVAGTIAALDNTWGVVGVAPRASLYSVKVLDRQGSGYLSSIVKGLEWCIQNRIQVVNMSFGTDEGNETFAEAIRAAYQAGLAVVASAGNSGPGANTVSYPARYPETIAVAACSSAGRVAPFSSRGAEVDVTAPGVDIYSTRIGGGYTTLSGTSMAAPHVTGLSALLLMANPALSPPAVRSAITSNAARLVGDGPEAQGVGLIDAAKAVAAVRAH